MQLKKIYLGPLNQPGDDLYSIYCMFPEIYSEREFLSTLREKECPDYFKAYTVANKAANLCSCGKNSEAEKMCYHSISIDPTVFDSHRVIGLSLMNTIDSDTIICIFREELCFMRPFLIEHFKRKAGDFFDNVEARPYLRVLEAIAFAANKADQLDVATFALEEILRLDHSDFNASRDLLLLCYLRLLGRKSRGLRAFPERTVEEIEQFMYCGFGYSREDSLFTFSSHEYIRRFAEILLMYHRNDERWKECCKSLEHDNKSMFKLMFNEESPSPIAFDTLMLGFTEETPEFANNRCQTYLRELVLDWPQFRVDMHSLLRKDPPKKFKPLETRYRKNRTEEEYENLKIEAEKKLNQGRKFLGDSEFLKAITTFSQSKKLYTAAAKDPKRWYTNEDAPFAIVTNRSTSAVQIQMWELVRIDIRFSLMKKPDHVRAYDRLPDIASAFYSPFILSEVQSLVKEVHSKTERPMDEWKKLAKKAVSLISLDALMLSRCSRFTLEVKKKVLARGIDDLFTTVNYGDYPHLPWIHQDFCEPEF